MLYSLYTRTEHRRLHRHIGHPRPNKLMPLLYKTDFENVSEDFDIMLEKLSLSCLSCQMFLAHPRRFLFTHCNDAQFNNTFCFDPFWVDRKPCSTLLMTRHVTKHHVGHHFSTLRNFASSSFYWIDSYIGLLMWLRTTLGKNL